VAELGPRPAFPDAWVTISNLALIPLALWLGRLLVAQSVPLSVATAAAGVSAAALWAMSYDRPDLEPVWLGLQTLWWLGLGILFWARRMRWTASFTIIVAAAAGIDTLAVLLGETGVLWIVAGAKLPLSFAWAFAIGLRLLVEPLLARPDRPAPPVTIERAA
jgi:hypothetical protein